MDNWGGISIATLSLCQSIITASIQPINLRCEYRVNPLGIDQRQPRLSWSLKASNPQAKGLYQTAYQILVASSRAKLDANEGDLWDTGKVESSQSSQIVYAGKPLQSEMECWWKVRVWDQNGRVSEWSEPARWTMGLLEPTDWQAKWIGYDAPMKEGKQSLTFENCKWIWFPEGDPRRSAPIDTRYFRRRLEVRPGRRLQKAQLLLTADDQFMLYINGHKVDESDGRPDAWRRPKMVDVTAHLRTGMNVIAIAVTNTGGPAGLIAKLVMEFEGGEPLVIVTDSSWRVTREEQDNWAMPDLDDSDWLPAMEIGKFGNPPWGDVKPMQLHLPPQPFLRKTFVVDKPIQSATAYVSALGTCEVHLNGKRITDDVFIPGRSDFRKRVYYRTYDVTELVQRGKNALGAILGDEWYAGYCGGWNKRNFYGGEPRLLIQLHLKFNDGTKQIITTDETWKATYGPILEADFYHGETYDARREMPGWDTPNFDDSNWAPVDVTEGVNLQMTAHPGPPVRRIMELKPISVNEVKPGVFIFDMGQNMVGWVRLRVRGASAGNRIVLRFAEVLNPDGTIYTANLRSARCTDTYICKGEAEEIWEPHFTFHGFRYVEVTGYPTHPTLDAITGIVVHSDVPIVGHFECSNSLVNRLFQNIVWGLRGNYLEVPTDCPQRDERQGWTGDAQIFARTASYIADIAAFMTKWLIDLNDGQREDGAYPDVAPVVGAGFGTPAWGDAGIIIPYMLYQAYGDIRIIERHYSSMAKYIDYLVRNSENYIRPEIGCGDWVPAGEDTPKDVLATAYFAYVVHLMAEMSHAIGRDEDARRYEELFENIKTAFNRAYVSPDGRIKGETQTCYALALYIDLLPQELRPHAVQHLVANIEKRNWHLSTGFVGTRMLLPVLTRFGRNDVAYRLFLQETYPSWLYPVKHGATTIWERWDSWTEERGFQTPSMNSFNHYAFGCVGEWMFDTVAGIKTIKPGFSEFAIRPKLWRGLKYVNARYDSIHGRIEVAWHLKGDALDLQVTIPVNTTARIHIPTNEPDAITESGRCISTAKDIQLIQVNQREVVVRVGSGRWSFSAPIAIAP